MSTDDLALETLLAVRETHASKLDKTLLENCYVTEKRHQFDRDRSLSTQAIERLIDEEVARVTAAEELKGQPK